LTTVWLKKHHRVLMSIYGKFMFKDSLERNMLSRSNMDHCLADETAEGLNEYLLKVQVQRFYGQKHVKLVKNRPLSG